MYATLGKIEFELITYWNSMDLEQGVDFAEHALIGRKPRLQCVGEKLATVKVGMKFHFQIADPEAEMTKLQKAMAERKSLKLVMGNGSYKGTFVIETIGIINKMTDKKGTTLACEMTVGLKEFVDSEPEANKKAAQQEKANGNIKSAPKTNTPISTTGKARNDPVWVITPKGTRAA